ncbi:MAG: hypothetical protein ABWX59_03600 [Microbacteriaceae bacterium]
MALAVLVGALTGCSVAAPESRLDVYEARAEDISAELIAQLPTATAVRTDSRAWINQTEWFVPSERQVAHWTAESTIEFAGDTASVAAALGTHLVTEDWTAESIVESDGAHSDVYRLGDKDVGGDGEWIVEVQWQDGRDLLLMVQSPVTVRGTEEAAE